MTLTVQPRSWGAERGIDDVSAKCDSDRVSSSRGGTARQGVGAVRPEQADPRFRIRRPLQVDALL